MSLSHLNLPPSLEDAILADATARFAFVREHLALAIEQRDYNHGVPFYIQKFFFLLDEKVLLEYVDAVVCVRVCVVCCEVCGCARGVYACTQHVLSLTTKTQFIDLLMQALTIGRCICFARSF